jgi:hypothetical protein
MYFKVHVDIRPSGQLADTGPRSTLLMPAVSASASPHLIPKNSCHTAPPPSSLTHAGPNTGVRGSTAQLHGSAGGMGQTNPLHVMQHSPSALSEHQYDVPFSHLAKPLDPVDVSGYSELGKSIINYKKICLSLF